VPDILGHAGALWLRRNWPIHVRRTRAPPRSTHMVLERLHRRWISTQLQKRRGWLCTSSVEGYVFVRPRTGDLPEGFGAEVRAEVRALPAPGRPSDSGPLGYEPTTAEVYRDSKRWIRVSTEETLAQAPRGGHPK
jgi:hypothetical protein